MRWYVYAWLVRPARGLEVEIRVEAPSAPVAQRQLAHFLRESGGSTWPRAALGRMAPTAPLRPPPDAIGPSRLRPPPRGALVPRARWPRIDLRLRP